MLNLESAMLTLLQGKGEKTRVADWKCVCVLEQPPDDIIISCHRSYLKGQRVEIWRLVGAEQPIESREINQTENIIPISHFSPYCHTCTLPFLNIYSFVSKGIVHNWTIQGKKM